jgi:hypothetical protein
VKRLAILDALAQQAAWWWAVLLAARGHAGLAAALPIAVVAAHLALRPEARAPLLAAPIGAALYGFATDGLLVSLGLLGFPGGGAPPAFMVALWAVFGAALTASLRSLASWRAWAVALVAAIAGPLAYRGGAALGALGLPAGDAAGMAAVAVQWAVGLPLLAAVARRAAASAPGRPCAHPGGP